MTSPRFTAAWAALLLVVALGAGCKGVPTSVLLQIEAAAGLKAPDELRLSVLEDAGFVVSDRRLPASGKPRLPDSLVLYPTAQIGSLRLLVRAQQKSAVTGEGGTRVTLQAGAQVTATVRLAPGALPDTDGDGVPDVVDNCPVIANPKQERCAGPDGGVDGPRDATREVGPDGARDTWPAGDRPRTDGARPDQKAIDKGPKLDKAKPSDTKPPADKPPADMPAPGTITVTAPGVGVVWPAGTSQTVQWTASGVAQVTIELWRGGLKQTTLASGIPSTGSYAWSIPATQSFGVNYQVRVVNAVNAAVFGSSPGSFTIANWQHVAEVTIDATNVPGNLTQHQVLLVLSSASFDYGKAKADGSDLRFSTSGVLGGAPLPYWIESWKSGSTNQSWIWVRVPSIQGGQLSKIYLYAGNPFATATSSLATAFPSRTISTGNLTLTGTLSTDWFELAPGHTLKIQAGAPLVINARRILIAGTVDGVGAGHAGGALGVTAGAGPGGGQSVAASGAPGGGHGGAGGHGGYDSGTIPGGGLAYGSAIDETIAPGSGGGGTVGAAGGAGGGALTLAGTAIDVTGNVLLTGVSGATSNQCSGGGSGGGLLLRGDVVHVASTCSVAGGTGGDGAAVSGYDGGGGGGGGRFKVFYQSSYVLDLAGGISAAGGAGGTAATPIQEGGAGGAGTTHTQQKSVGLPTISIGPLTPL